MAINIIESHHNLERDKLSAQSGDDVFTTPHRVRCLTCKVGPMTLEEAEQHAEEPLPKKTIGDPQTFRLFTLFP